MTSPLLQQSASRLLVVDDEASIRETLLEILEATPHKVDAAADGKEALEKWSQLPYDLMIIDLRMPRMDGETLIREIRKTDGDMALIVLTGHGELSQAYTLLKEYSISDFLYKPLEHPAQLLFSVENALEKRRLKQQSKQYSAQLAEANAELKQMNEQLELRVKERTAELQAANEQLQREIIAHKQAEEERVRLEKQLRHAQKMEAIGTLAGGIAHDFNNILGTILGRTELLLENHPEDSKERKYLERIYRTGERAADLVRQILTFSRSHEQQLKPTNIAPLIEETLSMMRATIPTTIDIRQHIQPSCHPILADVTQIQQVIVNLCVNASHAMRAKGGTLEVTLEEVNYDTVQKYILDLTAGSYLKLTVSDTGCGMASEVQRRIFEPFFTTKKVGKGTGLGLSVVHGIIEGHHGLITVESEPGKGATFRILFPTTDEREPQTEAPGEKPVSRGKESLLIVDDEPDLTELYEMALTQLGYHVTVFTDSYEALETFRAKPDHFDLVFTDQTMPKMTGAQLSQELLQIRADIPIILATGYSDSISEKEARDLGIRQFLRKPIKVSTLIQIIQKCLK